MLALGQGRSHGDRFPLVPAIPDRGGADAEPGYRQVYATDSERCGLLVTEHTGRRR